MIASYVHSSKIRARGNRKYAEIRALSFGGIPNAGVPTMTRPKRPFRAPNVEASPDTRGQDMLAGGCVIGVILLIVAIGQCSTTTPSLNTSDALNQSATDMGNAIAAQTPSPVEPLSPASVTRGVAHLRLAFSAENFSGAMIYSQNCYDALTRQFTWAKLDQCGASDTLAVRSLLEADPTGLDNETAYFQSETAAGRYLAAATSAGEPAGEADTRLSALQARVAHLRAVARRPAPAADMGNETAGEDDSGGLANQVAYSDDDGPGE
jgi:hypothetical protein